MGWITGRKEGKMSQKEEITRKLMTRKTQGRRNKEKKEKKIGKRELKEGNKTARKNN